MREWIATSKNQTPLQIPAMTETNSPAGRGGPYVFFLDGERHESANSTIRVLDLRALLPEAKRNYGLFEESVTDDPDLQFGDDAATISLTGFNPKKFYSVPSATYGSR